MHTLDPYMLMALCFVEGCFTHTVHLETGLRVPSCVQYNDYSTKHPSIIVITLPVLNLHCVTTT